MENALRRHCQTGGFLAHLRCGPAPAWASGRAEAVVSVGIVVCQLSILSLGLAPRCRWWLSGMPAGFRRRTGQPTLSVEARLLPQSCGHVRLAPLGPAVSGHRSKDFRCQAFVSRCYYESLVRTRDNAKGPLDPNRPVWTRTPRPRTFLPTGPSCMTEKRETGTSGLPAVTILRD
jgi:hypothetical protein